MNANFLLKGTGITCLAIFLGACFVVIPWEWYQLDLAKTWHKSFFENGMLAFRTTFCLVVLISILPVLGNLSDLSLIDRDTSMAKLMLLELLWVGMIAGMLFVFFSYHYNLDIYFYGDTMNAMITGWVSGLCLAWLGRFIVHISFHNPQFFSYR